MCRAIPGKILSVDPESGELMMAKVDFGGVIKEVSLTWLPESKVGDYVLAHVGFALNIIDEEDAEETLDLLRQMGEI